MQNVPNKRLKPIYTPSRNLLENKRTRSSVALHTRPYISKGRQQCGSSLSKHLTIMIKFHWLLNVMIKSTVLITSLKH